MCSAELTNDLGEVWRLMIHLLRRTFDCD